MWQGLSDEGFDEACMDFFGEGKICQAKCEVLHTHMRVPLFVHPSVKEVLPHRSTQFNLT